VRLPLPRTLFGRTAFAFTFAFLVFSLFSVSLVIYFVAMPLTKRAADDLSALIVLTTQIWVELPPGTRPDFEKEMLERHNLYIGMAAKPITEHDTTHIYIRYLEEALTQRSGSPQLVLMDAALPEWGWVDVKMGGRTLRVGFTEDRLITQIPQTMITMVLMGTLIAVITSLLLVRRITKPLAMLADATTRIGLGKSGEPLAEKGAEELVELTRNFNHMERQLKVLMDNRTTLFAGISHDLRTPIARMQLELELLDEAADPEMLDDMRQNLQEMNEIITATLQLSKGLGEQVLELVDLSVVVFEIANEFQRQAADIRLDTHESCYCKVSVSAFRRVINNLVQNAVRYSGNKPVTLKLVCHASKVVVQIVDRGPGIPPDLREEVFQPFKRLETSRSRASGGSGLGLAIVDQLCIANDWVVELKDSEYGGTTAELTVQCVSN
jgi:two-component system osmolarity sensor histidine kinase EnvZ